MFQIYLAVQWGFGAAKPPQKYFFLPRRECSALAARQTSILEELQPSKPPQ